MWSMKKEQEVNICWGVHASYVFTIDRSRRYLLGCACQLRIHNWPLTSVKVKLKRKWFDIQTLRSFQNFKRTFLVGICKLENLINSIIISRVFYRVVNESSLSELELSKLAYLKILRAWVRAKLFAELKI